MRLTIVIKALNEETHIAAAIESALAVVARVGGEVILADSASTDRTVEIARGYPIAIHQLEHPGERCCGIGPQLGYQHARGAFVWIADGDQVLQPDFAVEALTMLEEEPKLAGVAGSVHEVVTDNLEFKRRKEIKPDWSVSQREMKWLSQGGIYRRAAIESVGHFSDRNLHSYEEYDLGRRLRHEGWRLVRIAAKSCDHYGHSAGSYRLLCRRLTSKYAYGCGEALRAAAGQGQAGAMITDIAEVKLWAGILVVWLVLAGAVGLAAVTGWWPLPVLVAALPFAAALWKTRSLEDAVFRVASWNVFTLGFVLGLLSPRAPPERPIASRDLSAGR